MKHFVQTLFNGTGIKFDILVEEGMCQVAESNWIEKLDQSTKIAM